MHISAPRPTFPRAFRLRPLHRTPGTPARCGSGMPTARPPGIRNSKVLVELLCKPPESWVLRICAAGRGRYAQNTCDESPGGRGPVHGPADSASPDTRRRHLNASTSCARAARAHTHTRHACRIPCPSLRGPRRVRGPLPQTAHSYRPSPPHTTSHLNPVFADIPSCDATSQLGDRNPLRMVFSSIEPLLERFPFRRVRECAVGAF